MRSDFLEDYDRLFEFAESQGDRPGVTPELWKGVRVAAKLMLVAAVLVGLAVYFR